MTKSKPPIPERERRQIRQIRLAAVVMAATMVLWMGAQLVGGQVGLAPRFAFLFDLAAIAALVLALIVTYWVWKARRADRPGAAHDRPPRKRGQ